MTPEVEQAIEEIKDAYPSATLFVEEDQDGGASVIVETVDLGDQYANPETWVGFQITYQYPHSDVYPHFIRADLTRVDGRPLGVGMSPARFREREAIQCSRRSNRLDSSVDTAALKMAKVLDWIKHHE